MADARFPFLSFILGLISDLIACFQANLALLILQADYSRRRQNIIRLLSLQVSRGGRLDLPLGWLCFCPDLDILNCFCNFKERHNNINPHQRNSKMAQIYWFRGLIIANTYASSIRSRVSYRFQIDSSYTCGRAKTMRKCYEWTRILLENGEKELRFQTNTDTCGQGLKENVENWSLEQDDKTKPITIQSLPTKIDLQKDCVENPRRNRGTQRQFSENICSEDDSRSRIFGTFVVKFLACLPLLGFSNIWKMVKFPIFNGFLP